MRLRGWRPGFDKVRLTQLLRDEGLPLSEAMTATGRLLAGEPVTVRLPHSHNIDATRRKISEIGVASFE